MQFPSAGGMFLVSAMTGAIFLVEIGRFVILGLI
jgi:hypothetical protein